MKILDTSNFCWINFSHGDRKMILFQRTECNPHKNTSMEVQKFIPYTLYENIKWFESFFLVSEKKNQNEWILIEKKERFWNIWNFFREKEKVGYNSSYILDRM